MYRPQTLEQVVGQENIVKSLKVKIGSALKRGDVIGHTLFEGHAGFGKTTLARIIANEMKGGFHELNGATLDKKGLLGVIKKLQPGDIVFIDEIHRLSKKDQEFLFPIMEDFQNVPKFTLIGATTEGGMLLKPFYDRFKNKYQLVSYTVDEMFRICQNAAVKTFRDAGISIYKSGHEEICKRSRGTPRIGLTLLENVRDYAVYHNISKVDKVVASKALSAEEIGEDGSRPMDRKYLAILEKQEKPIGVDRIASMTGLDKDTIKNIVEPFLLSTQKITITGRGRILTKRLEEMS